MTDPAVILFLVILVFSLILFLVGFGFFIFTIFRWRGREKGSLDSVLLRVLVPRTNEVKIDAMEQVFASLYSIKKGDGNKGFLFNLLFLLR